MIPRVCWSDGALTFGSNYTLIQKKPFFVATQCERLRVGVGWDANVTNYTLIHEKLLYVATQY